MRAALGLVICCVAGCVAGCGSPTRAPGAVSEADNGHTLTVRTGADIRLVLHSTYWSFGGTSAPAVVTVVGSPTYSPHPGGIPGSGSGTTTETLRAVAPGRATLSASRLSCGEALRCQPGAGSYAVVIVVTGG
jgi:hypothetical protein